ncbi:MAG: hypothetical protein Q4G44_06005 [Alcaligenaceae bacterium]|nr:hypothetical protein [Alcaligenaceae bacterium]
MSYEQRIKREGVNAKIIDMGRLNRRQDLNQLTQKLFQREKKMKDKSISMYEFLVRLSIMTGEPESVELPLGKVLDDENYAPDPQTGEVIKPGCLYFKPVAEGVDVQQALENLLDDPLITKHYVRQVIVTDYVDIVGYDRLRAEYIHYTFAEIRDMTEEERNQPMKFFCTLAGLEREMFPCTREG